MDIQSKVNQLQNRSVCEQRSKKWKEFRHKHLTGCDCLTYTRSRESLSRQRSLLEKATLGDERTFFGNSSTRHGTILENVSSYFYTQMTGYTLIELGPIEHEKYTFLAPSTDGISHDKDYTHLTNVEIKSFNKTYSMKGAHDLMKTPTKPKVKKEHLYQMQLQMECLDIDQTDYITVDYNIINSYGDIITKLDQTDLADSISGHYGAVVVVKAVSRMKSTDNVDSPPFPDYSTFAQHLSGDNHPSTSYMHENGSDEWLMYFYSPIFKGRYGLKYLEGWIESVRDWFNDYAGSKHVDGDKWSLTFDRSFYWQLLRFNVRQVLRDRDWFTENLPKFTQFYQELEELRADSTKISQMREKLGGSKQVNIEPQLDKSICYI